MKIFLKKVPQNKLHTSAKITNLSIDTILIWFEWFKLVNKYFEINNSINMSITEINNLELKYKNKNMNLLIEKPFITKILTKELTKKLSKNI